MSLEIIYNKLIRDNIPKIIEKSGVEYKVHIAEEKEYIEKLIEKVSEELEEFVEKPCEEEMADILEVLETLSKVYKLDEQKIIDIKKDKKNKRGGFLERIILEKTIKK
ncbi:nucleoside triphosphate pyrophosphohydrolase [Haliovirga abyssi]|uniref:Phosphoribosyl-ATP pyrophosphohydrolase n=1 Tax=Haliovirga abyssi TaxID=2996794 RepID=A0AAU9D269_9FUSO|nr:nucleoside triphosphate pyrophosphohydrolase [Haliovirga abyssi]BDU50096.1 phosphoribosyl-ATP pyrophosphohydrolase [Haliovirga abyssi]